MQSLKASDFQSKSIGFAMFDWIVLISQILTLSRQILSSYDLRSDNEKSSEGLVRKSKRLSAGSWNKGITTNDMFHGNIELKAKHQRRVWINVYVLCFFLLLVEADLKRIWSDMLNSFHFILQILVPFLCRKLDISEKQILSKIVVDNVCIWVGAFLSFHHQ